MDDQEIFIFIQMFLAETFERKQRFSYNFIQQILTLRKEEFNSYLKLPWITQICS